MFCRYESFLSSVHINACGSKAHPSNNQDQIIKQCHSILLYLPTVDRCTVFHMPYYSFHDRIVLNCCSRPFPHNSNDWHCKKEGKALKMWRDSHGYAMLTALSCKGTMACFLPLSWDSLQLKELSPRLIGSCFEGRLMKVGGRLLIKWELHTGPAVHPFKLELLRLKNHSLGWRDFFYPEAGCKPACIVLT